LNDCGAPVSEGSVKKERKWVFGLMSDPSIFFFLVEQLSGVAWGGGVVLVSKQGGKELAF